MNNLEKKQKKIRMIQNQIDSKKQQALWKKKAIMDQIREAKEKHMEEEIQLAFDTAEQQSLTEEQEMLDMIYYVENDFEIMNFMELTQTPEQVMTFQDFVQEYDLGLYLDIEHASDKDWYVVCPMCKWSINRDVEEHTCTCKPIMVKGSIYYPAKNIPV